MHRLEWGGGGGGRGRDGVYCGISKYVLLLKAIEGLIENGVNKHWLIETERLIRRFVCRLVGFPDKV